MFVAYSIEERIPDDHPLLRVKAGADAVLADMRRDFDAAYAKTGRPGVPPGQLLVALRMLLRLARRHGLRPRTLGADAGYDDGGFLDELEREHEIVPHVPIRRGRIKAQDAKGDARRRARRRKRTVGYGLSQVRSRSSAG